MGKFILLLISFIVGYIGLFYYLITKTYQLELIQFLDIDYIKIIKMIHIDKTADTILVKILNGYFFVIPIAFVLYLININKLIGKYGNAEFANMRILRKMKLINKKNDNKLLHLGDFNNGIKTQKITTAEPLSTLILAPPGTGKSVWAINCLFQTNQSFIVLDIKGELFDTTSEYRKHYLNNEIYIFNPYRENSLKFNPLAKSEIENLSWDEKANLIKFIAEILYVGKDENDYFLTEGKTLFVGIGLYLIYKNGYTSIPKIRSFLLQDWEKAIRDGIKEEENLNDEEADKAIKEIENDLHILTFIKRVIIKDDGCHRQIKETFNSLNSKGVNELGGIMGSCKNSLNAFDNDSVIANMDDNDLDITELRRKKISIYIVIAENEIKSLAPIIKLYMEYVATILMSGKVNKKKDNKVIIVFDEFPRFGKLEAIVKAPALGRAYFLMVILIAQDYAQIKEVYSETAIDIINSTTAYKIIFAQGNDKTARMVSEMIGNTSYYKQTISENAKGEISKSKSLEDKPLISQQDISNLDKDKMLILVFRFYKNPIMAKPVLWYEDSEIKKKLDKLPQNTLTIDVEPSNKDNFIVEKKIQKTSNEEFGEIDFTK